MALTRAGKAFAMCTVGGGVINSSSITASRTMFRNIAGGKCYIASTYSGAVAASNSGYKYPLYICVGSNLLTDSSDDNLGVYSLENLQRRPIKTFDSSSNSANIPYFDVAAGITRISFSITNDTTDALTFRYYGLSSSIYAYNLHTSNNITSYDILVSYYQFPEPIVVQPGETKTIQVEIDVSNL